MGALKKSALRNDPGAALLRQVSKAALVDLILDMISLDGAESCDDPVTVERVRKHLGPALERRGDRMPAIRPACVRCGSSRKVHDRVCQPCYLKYGNHPAPMASS